MSWQDKRKKGMVDIKFKIFVTMQFVEPIKDGIKLFERLNSGEYKRVIILFGHGLGDCIMFVSIFERLRLMYPNIKIDIALQKGLDEEILYPDAFLFTSVEEVLNQDYDLCIGINFPVETDPDLTKSELCCREELGIEPYSVYKQLPSFKSKLCAVHFNLTCLPGLANPDRDTAEKIWNEIREAGWIPIESHFEHTFHNPVNAKFDFVDCTVRRCQPRIGTLIGLLQHCGAFIGVVSGNFHTAMASMPHDRIAFLEKDIPVKRFTHEDIKIFDIKNYQGGIKDWLWQLN
jgi:hypothetical protein